MNKKYLIGALILSGLLFEAGRFSKPAQIKVVKEKGETVTITKEVVVTKVVDKTKTTKPDGTIVETEHSTENQSSVENTKDKTYEKTAISTKRDVGLTLSALAIVDSSDIQGHRDYGIHVTKRVFSNVVVGAIATTDKKIGVSIGLEF